MPAGTGLVGAALQGHLTLSIGATIDGHAVLRAPAGLISVEAKRWQARAPAQAPLRRRRDRRGHVIRRLPRPAGRPLPRAAAHARRPGRGPGEHRPRAARSRRGRRAAGRALAPVALLRAADPRRSDRHDRRLRLRRSVDAVRRSRRGPARHARVHDPRAPRGLPLARGTARRGPDGAAARRDRARPVLARRKRRRARARPARRRRAGLLAALQVPAGALRGRAPRARVRAAPPLAGVSRVGASCTEGSGRSPSAGPSPRTSPVRPRLCRRAISRSPSRRAGWPAGRPAISFAMRLRSCRAKWGVEAPISWRTSSTVTSRAMLAAGVFGFAHAASPRPIRSAAQQLLRGRPACGG